MSTPKRLAPEVHVPRGYLFWYLWHRVAIDTAAFQEQTISDALDSEYLEGNSADAMAGARPPPTKTREMREHLPGITRRGDTVVSASF